MVTDYVATLPLRFIKGVFNFLYFWYVKSSKDFWYHEIAFIRGVENDIGIIINLKLITQPIFGDYTYIGRVIGPIFRLGRVIIGSMMILLSFFAIVSIYILWILFPIVAIIMALRNLLYVLAN